MISLAARFTGTVTEFQVGPINSIINATIDILAIAAGAQPNNTFVLAFYVHAEPGLANPNIPTINTIPDMALISDYADRSGPADAFLWAGWASVFQASSTALPAVSVIYTPIINNLIRTVYVRYNVV